MVESFPHALAFWASTDPIGFIQAMCAVLIGPVSIAGSIWAPGAFNERGIRGLDRAYAWRDASRQAFEHAPPRDLVSRRDFIFIDNFVVRVTREASFYATFTKVVQPKYNFGTFFISLARNPF